MPAQGRLYQTPDDDSTQLNRSENDDERSEEPDESDRSSSSTSIMEDKDEFVTVNLAEIRKEVQCPICLGIIRKTRTVMECLHRFCRGCIDKSMRLGNNECPACRTHCASRRSLRDDPNYDALIAIIYPDIDKYEEEELAFHEEEKARNKQIQASIAQTFRRQSEALGKKRTAKATAVAFVRRSHGSYRNANLRRRNYQTADLHESDNDEDMNNNGGGKDSSSNDELMEMKPKRYKRCGVAQFSQSPSAAPNTDGVGDDNDSELSRDLMSASAGLVSSSERLSWGKGGMRSHTRQGGFSGSNGKITRNTRVSKLIDNIRNLEENHENIYLRLVSIDEATIPTLQRPYICCRPGLSIKHLCQYVAFQSGILRADEVEIYLVKDLQFNLPTSINVSTSNSTALDPCGDKLQFLRGEETLAGVEEVTSNSCHGHRLLAYRRKTKNTTL